MENGHKEMMRATRWRSVNQMITKSTFLHIQMKKILSPQPVFIFKFLSKAAIKLSAVVQTEMSKREEDGLGQKAKREKPRLGQRQEV